MVIPCEMYRVIRERVFQGMCQTYGAVHFSSDSVTKREELLSFASKAEVIEFAQSITDEVNKRWQGKGTPWVFLLDDPGYVTNKKSEAGENKHLGIHVLMNRQAKRGQKPHIDGIGSPFEEEIPKNLEDFQGPLSVAFFLTESKNTQFGENIKLANMFYEMLDGDKSPEDLCDEVTEVLQRNEEFFDAEFVPTVPEGTCHVFPKNLKVHRGTARGSSTDLDDMRVVIYFTLCRQDQFQKYVNDKMETAELAPGFNDGKFGKGNLEIWAQQWLVAHLLKYDSISRCARKRERDEREKKKKKANNPSNSLHKIHFRRSAKQAVSHKSKERCLFSSFC